MRDESLLISAEDLLEIFSKVTEEYRKRVKLKNRLKGKGKPRTAPKISHAELLAIFKKVSKHIK
jgi:hypothetical protein